MSLPPEVCALICKQPSLHRKDLRSLCSVSASFRAEAERLLYTHVCLRSLRHIRSWCVSLATRPHLAARVLFLSLSMPSSFDLAAADYSLLLYALGACSNLKDLHFLCDGRSPEGDATQILFLEGHPWQLLKFTNSYFNPALLRFFFESQPSMQTLVIRAREYESPKPVYLPRNLTTLDTSAAVLRSVANASGLRVRRLQYHMAQTRGVDELPTFVALARLSHSLTTLSIVRHGIDEGMDVAVVAACIAAQLPRLRYFRLMDNTIRSQDSLVPLLPFSINFEHIETFIIKPATRLHEDDDILRCVYRELDTEHGRSNAAMRIMQNLPTLSFLSFVLDHDYAFERIDGDVIVSLGIINLDSNNWMEA
ncbi:hypothetical protein APHAL10511_002265 [Amanita phalloides]|nr:hypothetical protein APHAL10511_002265 [Amanita phalloides]